MPDFNNMPELNICLLLFSILVNLVLLAGTLMECKPIRSYIKSFTVLLVVNICMQAGEMGIWLFDILKNPLMIKVCSFLSFACSPALMVTFNYCLIGFVREKKEVSYRLSYLVSALCGIYFILTVCSLFNGMIFDIDVNGSYMDGTKIYISYIFDVVLFIIEIVQIIKYWKILTVKGIVCLTSFCMVSLFTMVLQNVWYPIPELMMTTLSMIMMFMLFYGEQRRQLAEKERQLAESGVALAVSQIQPHFIYNTLATIKVLCRKNSAMAEEVTGQFARYLRVNLDKMGSSQPIMFDRELEHVKTYLWIEQVRFGDELLVKYDIQVTDFFIPALTVQPIVENAVKHGMMGKDETCTITISASETDRYYEIQVKDDGAGFSTDNMPQDKRAHVGIESVRTRLWNMVRGTLDISSKPGEGTWVTIRIPKENTIR